MNSRIPARLVKRWCHTNESAAALLENAADKLSLSARSVHRVLRIARTIADLDGAPEIRPPHIAEALQFRPPEALAS